MKQILTVSLYFIERKTDPQHIFKNIQTHLFLYILKHVSSGGNKAMIHNY